MAIVYRTLWQEYRSRLKVAWFIAAGLLALCIGAIQRSRDFQGIAEQKAIALAAIEQNRHEHWFAPSLLQLGQEASIAAGVVGGVPGGLPARSARMMTYLPTSQQQSQSYNRKMVRTASLDLLAKNPADVTEKIRVLSVRLGGFLVKSESNGAQDATSASLTIRVPAQRFEEVRAEIRKLGLRVESERLEAEDVTRQYVDQDARLRNLRAQETQYLLILKHAKTVKDTLEVSDKLNEVRGAIEQQQAESDALSKQVETVAISVSLHSETEAQAFGLHWRPAYELKLAVMQGLEGLANYVTAMFSFVFCLPAILLWLATILIGAAIGWRILRWAARMLFAFSKPAMTKASS